MLTAAEPSAMAPKKSAMKKVPVVKPAKKKAAKACSCAPHALSY